jgi:hypothetical protein
MKFYLASRFEKQAFLRQKRDEILIPQGHEVTSRWLDLDKRADREHPNWDERRHARDCAYVDLADIDKADVMILDTLFEKEDYRTYGAFVELGYCLGTGKPVWLIGDTANQFHLWRVLGKPLPMSFTGRHVSERSTIKGIVQRPWPPGEKPEGFVYLTPGDTMPRSVRLPVVEDAGTPVQSAQALPDTLQGEEYGKNGSGAGGRAARGREDDRRQTGS